MVDLESMLTDSRYTPALEMLGEVELRYWLYWYKSNCFTSTKVPVLTLEVLGEVEIGRMDALDMRARRVMQARLIAKKKRT